MEISVMISLTLHFILGIFGLKQHMKIGDIWESVGPLDNFYNVKMESLYQCMEFCLQFTACNGVTYIYSWCYLHNDGLDAMEDKLQCICGSMYFQRTEFPDHISGACLNHNCSLDTRCLAITGTSNHICVPHNLPTFTCPWYWLRHGNSCYRPFLVSVTWQSAFDQCKYENASLIEIHDKDTQNYLYKMMFHFTHPHISGSAYMSGVQLVWTALTDKDTDGEWIWRGSGKVLAGYTHWTANATWEKLVPGNDCVGMSTPDRCRWKPVKCDSLLFYVCEKLMVE